MLRDILVRDFAIVDELELDFGDGMTAMTGETGAGKSILVDALGLVLGDRADSSSVRGGAERAEVAATFSLSALPQLQAWLLERDLGEGEECFLRRVVNTEGRSRAYVNGTPVPAQLLRELGEQLIGIHGQHEHQALLRRDRQRRLLDGWAGNTAKLDKVISTYGTWKRLGAELEALREGGAQRTERIQLLEFQVQELEALGLRPGEAQSLDEEHARLSSAGLILQTCQTAVSRLYDDDSDAVHTQLAAIATQIRPIADIDPALSTALQTLEEAAIQIQETSQDLRRYGSTVDLDPQRLNEVETRISTVHELARKHRVEPSALPALLDSLAGELETLRGGDLSLEDLEDRLRATERDYRKAAAGLSRARARAAKALSEAITESMQGLGMPGGQFEISLHTDPDGSPAADGLDAVEFLVSANPGEPLKSLGKVASGGELSRVSLALQVMTWNAWRVPTLIFDEVDSGIGGATAGIVGQLLRRLGGSCQVMCVTHLPQVASQAHQHYRVTKTARGDRTTSAVEKLDEDARISEIARMLGGLKLTENTLTHAREMIELTKRPD